MSKKKILIQLDPDPHPSSFDAIVAIDSGVDHLLRYSQVSEQSLEGLVHGAMFTRGPADLKQTALFFGGSNIGAAEALVAQAKKTFFGPVRVSLMSDPNGSNTTAVAAVLSAEKHVELKGSSIAVLGGTGPVGARIARICAARGASVKLASRSVERAQKVCDSIVAVNPEARLVPTAVEDSTAAVGEISDCEVVFAAGAAGIELLSGDWIGMENRPKVLIDVNAVPPAGIAEIGVMDKARELNGSIVYGAIGVGGLKMKIHKACLRRLFESNDAILEVDEIYELGRGISVSATSG